MSLCEIRQVGSHCMKLRITEQKNKMNRPPLQPQSSSHCIAIGSYAYIAFEALREQLESWEQLKYRKNNFESSGKISLLP
jgi:hypothetical protein